MPEQSPGLIKTVRVIDKFTDTTGVWVAWLNIPLVLAVSYEVIARYAFDAPTIWSFDVTYMLYGTIFMLGAAYALHKGAHIRTDFFYETWSARTKVVVDSISYILFFFPSLITLLFLALSFGYFALGKVVFDLAYFQTIGLMKEEVLAAVPLFIFMGFITEQAGLMERLFSALRMMLAPVRGSLYIVVILTSTVFAMATGIVGAAVTVLGIMAGPIMIKTGYDAKLSAGAITAGGTLGILIPPSVMLIVMGPVLGVSVADLYAAAFGPGFMLAGIYLVYLVIRRFINPKLGPPVPPVVMLAFVVILLFLLGWPFEWPAIILVFLPIFYPVVDALRPALSRSLGIPDDLFMVWFGSLVAVTMQTAYLSPPVAMSAYYLKQVVKEWSLLTIYKGMFEFMVLQCIAIAIVMFVPGNGY